MAFKFLGVSLGLHSSHCRAVPCAAVTSNQRLVRAALRHAHLDCSSKPCVCFRSGTCVLSMYTAVKTADGKISDNVNGTAMLGVTGACQLAHAATAAVAVAAVVAATFLPPPSLLLHPFHRLLPPCVQVQRSGSFRGITTQTSKAACHSWRCLSRWMPHSRLTGWVAGVDELGGCGAGGRPVGW